MLKTLFGSIFILSLALFVRISAPEAHAALTVGATSINSDGNITLGPTSNLGIGNANPQALLHVGTAGTRAGIIKLDGATSGTITIQPAAAAGTWTFTLPADDGTNGQVLTTDGSGVTSWTTIAAGGANTALSNLASVAINTPLVFAGGTTQLSENPNIEIGLFISGGDTSSRSIYAPGNLVIESNVGLDGSGNYDPALTLSSTQGAIMQFGTSRISIATNLVSFQPDNTMQYNVLTTSFSASNVAPDLGLITAPFGNLYLLGSGTFGSTSIKLTGTPTGNRVATFQDASGIVQISSTGNFSTLPTCNSTTDGMMRGVNDSNTITWGATIAGGSTNHVLAFCNGTNWTVAGK